MNPLKQLLDYGQSVWLDFIRRNLITSGDLHRLILDDGLRGDARCQQNRHGDIERHRDGHLHRQRNRNSQHNRHGDQHRHADRYANSEASAHRRAENGEIQKGPHGKPRDQISYAAQQEQDGERCSLGAADDGTILQHREQRLCGRDPAARDLPDRCELCPVGARYEQRNTDLHRSIEEQRSPGEAQRGRCRDARLDALPHCHINFQCHAKSDSHCKPDTDRHRRHAHRDADLERGCDYRTA